MVNKGKKNICGVMINAIDYESAVEEIINAALEGKQHSVAALAVHGVMTGVMNRTHRHRLNHLDIVVPDGQPVRWALNLLYKSKLADRVYGPELMLRVCKAAADKRLPIYLYGSKPAVLIALKNNLQKKFPHLIIAGASPSRFRRLSPDENKDMISTIHNSKARIIFIGLGCPRQEVWVYENTRNLGIPAIAIGAAFDFHAGTLKQAPSAMQKMGLEWLFRLLCEPFRLWKRYLFLNPYFVALLLFQIIGIHCRCFDLSTSIAPENETFYG